MVLTILFFLAGYLIIKAINWLFPNKKQPVQPLLEESAALRELKQQKTQLQSTMEQLNSPATFAQYSKMQRQAQQLSYKIVELQTLEKRQQQQNRDPNAEYQDEQQLSDAQAEATNLFSKPTVIKIVAVSVLVLVGTFFEICHVPDELTVFPTSLLLDGRNYASGATVVLLSVMLA